MTHTAKSSEYFSDGFLLANESIPEVLTAVRLRQPAAEVPASVTVIDQEQIKASGAKEITELLRYVPGFLVAPEPLDNSDSVVYHGGPALYPKSMEVLIDGRAVYRSGLAAVSWYSLPVAVEEIQRIEVVRGPNSTAYGTNAYNAVINIITQHPSDTVGSHEITASQGNTGYQYFRGQTGFRALKGDWRLTAVDRGTNHMKDAPVLNEFDCITNPCSDRRDTRFAHLRGFYNLSDGNSLDISAVMSESRRQLPDFGLNSNIVKEEDYEVGARYYANLSDTHQVKISAYTINYRRMQTLKLYDSIAGIFDPDLGDLYQINPDAAVQIANGQLPTSIDQSNAEELRILNLLATRYSDPTDFIKRVDATSYVFTTENRGDIEIQDTYVPTPELTILSGVGFRYDSVESDSYYKGTIKQNTARLFGNINWRASDKWVLHSGTMIEATEEYKPSRSFKAAANYMLSSLKFLRFVYSHAMRTPDFIEEHAKWSYQTDEIQTDSPYATGDFYPSFVAEGGLSSESISSYELGYYGKSPDEGPAEWDIRAFYEVQDDVIYLLPTIWSDGTYDDNHIRFYGTEWQLSLRPNIATTLKYNGAYVMSDTDTQDGLTEDELIGVYAPWSHNLSWNQRWSGTLSSTIALIIVNGMGLSGDSRDAVNLQRMDATIYGTTTSAAPFPIDWRLSVQQDISADPYLPNGQVYDEQTRIQAGLQLNF